MTLRSWVAVAVFGLGAALSAVWAFNNLQPLIELYRSDSGGGGFASTGPVELLTYIGIPVLAFALSRGVRQRGRVAGILRRAHFWTTLACVALFAIFVAGMLSGVFANGVNGLWIFFGALIVIAVWPPMQTFFSAAFIGVLIKERADG